MAENTIIEDLNSLQVQINNLQKQINNMNLLTKVYPVGSIYMSTSNISPQSFLGGTWQKIEERFLFSSSANYSNGRLGGESGHILTQSEMPNYKIGFLPVGVMSNHGQWQNGGIKSSSQTKSGQIAIVVGDSQNASDGSYQWGWNIYTNGSSVAHNNMPPYLVVNMWKRTA